MIAIHRLGKVVLVLAVVFFLSVSFAFGGVRRHAESSGVGFEIPVDVILVPVKMLKDFTLALVHVIQAGKAALLSVGIGTDSRGEAVSFL